MVGLGFIMIIILSFSLMEGVSWLTHKYVMHGFLWYLHKDHHQPQPGLFEKNDSFFLIFATPGFLCTMYGFRYKIWWMAAIGFGITLYGVAYFLVHDVIIHQRFKWFTKSNNRYILTLRRAHKLHHKHLDKENGESFGMLLVDKKYYQLIKQPKRQRTSIN